jgi:hypothetical protein
MKQTNLFSFGAALIACSLVALPSSGLATVVTLTDQNSVASVDVDSAAGMYLWSVDGQNQLNKQWFWFQIGSGGVQQPVNSIGPAVTTSTGPNQMSSTYSGAGYEVVISYLLTGGSSGSGTADIQESIMFCNDTGAAVDFHLYQYSDFNLAGTPGGDSVYIDGSSAAGYNYAIQWKGPTQIAEAINLPAGNHAEANTVPNTLNSLTTTADLVLNDNTYDTGDVSWALQWDVTVADGADFYVFKDKLLSVEPVPEPTVLALFALGLGIWGAARRRQ